MLTPSELASRSFRLTYKVPEVGGVYLIYCSTDQKGYIGSTTRVYMRLYGHRAKLKKGKHANPHLQAAYNKYGFDSFSFLTVELCPGATPLELLARENFYLLQMNPKEVFNMAIPAVLGGPVGIKRSPEHIAAISAANKGNSWAKGLRHTDEWKAATSARLKGKKQTSEQIANAVAGRKAAKAADPLMSCGTRNGRAKLNEEQVREIRALYAAGGISQTKLAERFGVIQTVISSIIRLKLWPHVK